MSGSAATKLNNVGPEGNDGILNLIADDGDDDADHWRALSSTDGSFYLQNYTSGSWEKNLKATGNAGVDLYYDNTKRFETMSTGAYVEGYLNFPDSGGTRIGSGNDIVITHNGSNSSITNNTGGFYVSGDGTDLHLRSAVHTTFSTGGSNERMRIDSSGNILLSKGVQNTILSNTSDGSDSQSIFVGGGGGASDTRGAYVWAKGNEYTTTGGYLQLNAGNVGTSGIMKIQDRET